jgi:toxin ParE1/3/4
MGWPVILTPQSQDDLREIVSYIARDSPDDARRFGHLVVDVSSVREVFRGAYRIIYEVGRSPNAVFVLRFWHSARGKAALPKV